MESDCYMTWKALKRYNYVGHDTGKRVYGIISPPESKWINLPGDVSELADEHDLGSCAARREGSTPSVLTKILDR